MAGMKMSNSFWKKQLSEKLKSLAPRFDARVAVVGVGAELNGDDAVGLLTARKLLLKTEQRDNLLVLEGGALPESVSGPLRRFDPDLLIFIDAADLGKPAGTIEAVAPERIGGSSFSTHSMPLRILMDYLSEELRCDEMLIGVQPLNHDFGAPLSTSGKKAAARLAAELSRQFTAAGLLSCEPRH